MKIQFKTIGSDPEFFIKRKKDDIYIPSSFITEGTKKNPQKTDTEGFLIHKDNLSVEGNIPPANNKKEFIENIMFIKNIINLIAETKKCYLVSVDEANFAPRFLNTGDGQEYGCSKDFNVWTKLERETPKLGNSKFRYAGFHIHIGYENNTPYTKEDVDIIIGRAFDLFLTLPSDEIKYTKDRRETYGAYGSIRHTDYGIECRTLGSYFTQDKYLGKIYDQVEKMFTWLNEGNNFEKLLQYNYTVNYTSRVHTMKVVHDLELLNYYKQVINKKEETYV